MISHKTQVRVRYGEVDRMGFFYHSHYVELFDIGRTELMREIGMTNFAIEASGIELPVVKVEVNYKLPALYDDLLTVETTLAEIPRATISFNYRVFRTPSDATEILPDAIATGVVTLAFMNRDTKRACRPPAQILDAMKPYFNR